MVSSSDIAALMEQAQKVIATLDRIAVKLANERVKNQSKVSLLSPQDVEGDLVKPSVSCLSTCLRTDSPCSYDVKDSQFASILPGNGTILDAHKVFDEMSDRNFALNVVPTVKTDLDTTHTPEIGWKNEVSEDFGYRTVGNFGDEVGSLDARNVLDEIPLPDFIREMAETVRFEEETVDSSAYQVFDDLLSSKIESIPLLSLELKAVISAGLTFEHENTLIATQIQNCDPFVKLVDQHVQAKCFICNSIKVKGIQLCDSCYSASLIYCVNPRATILEDPLHYQDVNVICTVEGFVDKAFPMPFFLDNFKAVEELVSHSYARVLDHFRTSLGSNFRWNMCLDFKEVNSWWKRGLGYECIFLVIIGASIACVLTLPGLLIVGYKLPEEKPQEADDFYNGHLYSRSQVSIKPFLFDKTYPVHLIKNVVCPFIFDDMNWFMESNLSMILGLDVNNTRMFALENGQRTFLNFKEVHSWGFDPVVTKGLEVARLICEECNWDLVDCFYFDPGVLWACDLRDDDDGLLHELSLLPDISYLKFGIFVLAFMAGNVVLDMGIKVLIFIPTLVDKGDFKGEGVYAMSTYTIWVIVGYVICPNQHQSEPEKLYISKLPVTMAFGSFIFDPGGDCLISETPCTSASNVSKVLLLPSVVQLLKHNLRVAIECFKTKVTVFVFDPGIMWGRIMKPASPIPFRMIHEGSKESAKRLNNPRVASDHLYVLAEHTLEDKCVLKAWEMMHVYLIGSVIIWLLSLEVTFLPLACFPRPLVYINQDIM